MGLYAIVSLFSFFPKYQVLILPFFYILPVYTYFYIIKYGVSDFFDVDIFFQENFKKITALKRTNKELAHSNAKLQVLDEAKDTFLSIASHELRTPMTVISGFSDLLLSNTAGKLTKKQKEFLHSISQNAKELTTLVNKMLDISALEAGKMDFVWGKVSFPQCLEKIVQEFAIIAKEKQIQIEFQNPDTVSLSLKTDPFKIKQIMGNLLGNALKFTPEKGTVRVLLEKGATPKSSVKISVIDTGIGIPEKEQHMIFEKFYRTAHSAQTIRSGTGLGLHIVKLLVEKLGGEISVVSSENKGSCFTFTLKG